MFHAIVPVRNTILCAGKSSVEELTPGDAPTGYDISAKSVRSGIIREVRPVEGSYRIMLPVSQAASVNIAPETILSTPHGDMPLGAQGLGFKFHAYCVKTPKLLLVRTILDIVEYPNDTSVVELIWDGAPYLWLSGALVGAPL